MRELRRLTESSQVIVHLHGYRYLSAFPHTRTSVGFPTSMFLFKSISNHVATLHDLLPPVLPPVYLPLVTAGGCSRYTPAVGPDDPQPGRLPGGRGRAMSLCPRGLLASSCAEHPETHHYV